MTHQPLGLTDGLDYGPGGLILPILPFFSSCTDIAWGLSHNANENQTMFDQDT